MYRKRIDNLLEKTMALQEERKEGHSQAGQIKNLEKQKEFLEKKIEQEEKLKRIQEDKVVNLREDMQKAKQSLSK